MYDDLKVEFKYQNANNIGLGKLFKGSGRSIIDMRELSSLFSPQSKDIELDMFSDEVNNIVSKAVSPNGSSLKSTCYKSKVLTVSSIFGSSKSKRVTNKGIKERLTMALTPNNNNTRDVSHLKEFSTVKILSMYSVKNRPMSSKDDARRGSLNMRFN